MQERLDKLLHWCQEFCAKLLLVSGRDLLQG